MKKIVLLSSMLMMLMVSPVQVIALTLDTSSPQFVGWINDGIPANPANETTWINKLITLNPGTVDSSTSEIITRSSYAFLNLPSADYTDTYKNESGSNKIQPGWYYLLGKYGNVGSLVWYISGITEEISIPQKWGADIAPKYKDLGLSHYSLYNTNPVPEPATMFLLGLGLLGIAGISRRK